MIGRIVASLASLTFLAGAMTMPAQAAEVNQGTWQNASCGNSQANYITLPLGQRKYGFGNTTAAARLIRGADGTAGVQCNIGRLSGLSDGFQQIEVWIRDAGVGTTRNDTDVQFCFQSRQTGSYFTRTLKLSQMTRRQSENGWTYASANTRDFQMAGNSAALVKVSFILPVNGNIDIGDTRVSIYPSNSIRPIQLDLNNADCAVLTTCPNADVVVN